MAQRLARVLLCTALVLSGVPGGAQPPVQDPEVRQGIKQVDDGEYDAAILTLDRAARRLAQDPSKLRESAQAYLYLGIAYIGIGQEAAARARFREALRQAGEQTLSPEKFPPKVINAYEAAKAEIAQATAQPSAAPEPAPAPRTAAPPPKKKGSKTPLILVGLAAVGGGVALAAGGGSSPPANPGGGGDAGNLARFYGSYSVTFTSGPPGTCGGASASLVLSGNPDGSNFQAFTSYGPHTFRGGTIQTSGEFTGTDGSFSVRGQTNGSRIFGNKEERGGCSWTFDGSR